MAAEAEAAREARAKVIAAEGEQKVKISHLLSTKYWTEAFKENFSLFDNPAMCWEWK